MSSPKKIASAGAGALSPLTGVGSLGFLPDKFSAGGFFNSNQIQPQQFDPLRPEYRGLSSDLGSYARTLVGGPATPYTGSFTAPMSQGESDILRQITQSVVGGDGVSQLPFGDQRSALISDILSGRRLNPATNPYLGQMTDAIRDQGSRTLGTNLNMVDAMFGKSGMLGPSSGRSAEGIATARQSTGDTNNTIAGILGSNYQQGLNEQMTTLGQILPQMDQTRMTNLYNALGANALPRSIQQNDLAARYQEFLRQLQEPLQRTQLASQILGSSPGMQMYMPQYQPSQFSQILAGAGQIGQAALPFMMM